MPCSRAEIVNSCGFTATSGLGYGWSVGAISKLAYDSLSGQSGRL
jgi:hypothetical protein